MPFYNDSTIKQLRDFADISIIIEQFVPLKRASGGKFLGVCPFHDDKRPSMNVNPSMGIYKCFACGAGGDVFRFVMEHEKMDFRTAVQFVAGVVGFNLPSLSQEQDENFEEKDIIRKLNEIAQNFFREELSKSAHAKKYLDEREISENTRDLFGFGYAPSHGLIELAVKNGFKPEAVIKAGLANEKNGKALDKFYDRLMLPICSLSGAVVGFGGRDLSGNSPAKYMNSPETELYSKSEILYGLNKSRRAIQKENSVILVEGYFDLISLFQAGIENVVAISGIALSDKQCRNLARYTKSAFISLDGDAAGQRATGRCIEVLLSQSFAVNIVNLTSESGEKIDPDSLVKKEGAEAFKNLLGKSADWLEYLRSQSNPNSAEEKANFVSKVKNLIATMNNAELRNQYLNLLQERFNVSRALPYKNNSPLHSGRPMVAPTSVQDTLRANGGNGNSPSHSGRPMVAPTAVIAGTDPHSDGGDSNVILAPRHETPSRQATGQTNLFISLSSVNPKSAMANNSSSHFLDYQVKPDNDTHSKYSPPPTINYNAIPGNEIRLVNLIFKNPQLQNLALAHCDPSLFTSSYLGELLDYGYALYEESGKIDLKTLYEKLPPEHRELLWRLPDEKWTEENALREFSSGVLKMLISKSKNELRAARGEIALYMEIQNKIKLYENLMRKSENGEMTAEELP